MRNLTLTAVAVLALLTAGCQPEGDRPDQQSTLVRTLAGDGIHVVGEDVDAGAWTPVDNWRDTAQFPHCVWFVSPASTPAPAASPSHEPTSTAALVAGGPVVVRLHAGEAFTSTGCGRWERTGD